MRRRLGVEAPAGTEQLRIDFAAPRIDGDGQLLGAVTSRSRDFRHHRQAGNADRLRPRRERQGARCRNADARAGERAGPDGDRDAAEVDRS